MTEFDLAYWNRHWAAKMPWSEFVAHVKAGVPTKVLAAKLDMALNPTAYKWVRRAREELRSGKV